MIAAEATPAKWCPRPGSHPGAAGPCDAPPSVGLLRCLSHQEAFAVWKARIAATEEWLDGLTDLGAMVLTAQGEEASVRDIIIHMIEEYAPSLWARRSAARLH